MMVFVHSAPAPLFDGGASLPLAGALAVTGGFELGTGAFIHI